MNDIKNCLLRIECHFYCVFGIGFSVTLKKPNIFQEYIYSKLLK